jgi:hypothetical protein
VNNLNIIIIFRRYKVLISGLPFTATTDTVLELVNKGKSDDTAVEKSDIKLGWEKWLFPKNGSERGSK